MDDYIVKNNKKLKLGYTTGSTATAAVKACMIMLLSNESISHVNISTKFGKTLTLEILDIIRSKNQVTCAVIKDAGDDPDVTHGIKIYATVSKTQSGIVIDGGEGVGRVQRPGLKIPIGKAAINPAPLETINQVIKEVSKKFNYNFGINALIFVPNGKEIAKRTMNERLGITNGISILGTTGIVEPMSEKALIDTIKVEIDMQVSNKAKAIYITPGNYGKNFAKDELMKDTKNFIKCSNFIGETLDYINYKEIKEVFLVGHIGKLIKIAGGIMNTHSSMADCRLEIIAVHTAMAGASSEVVKEIVNATTTDMAIDIMKILGVNKNKKIWNSIEERISFHLRERTKGSVTVKYIVFSNEHGVLLESSTKGN